MAGAVTKGVADGMHAGARKIAENRGKIADATSTAVGATGRVLEGVGDALSAGAKKLAENSSGAGGKAIVGIVRLTGRTAKAAGKATRTAAPATGKMVAGGATGVTAAAAGALDAVAISERDLADLQQRLDKANKAIQASSQARCERIASARQGGQKQELLSYLAVGGISLSAMASEGVPPEVEEAFRLAYPGLAAQGQDFIDAVGSKSAAELMGLVNGVKGKLFELQLVEHLNSGNLPSGLQASLATSATQPGYDLLISGGDGHVVDVMQAKATESAAYVKEALARYPDIDVSTTTEVYAQLLAQGVKDGVTDSGISEAVLQAKVESAAQAAGGAADWCVSGTASAALMALSVFMDKSVSPDQRWAAFGERSGGVGVSGAAGKAVLAATGYWWLALAAGVGARVLARHGGGKRARLDSLQALVKAAERVAVRQRQQVIHDARREVVLIAPKVTRRRAPRVAKATEPPARLVGSNGESVASTSTASAPVRTAAEREPTPPTAPAPGLMIRRVSREQAATEQHVTARDVVMQAEAKARRRVALRAPALALALVALIAAGGAGVAVWMNGASDTGAPVATSNVSLQDSTAKPEAELKAILDDAIKKYPYLATTAGLEATREIIAERDRRWRAGESPQDALRGALQAVAPKYAPKARKHGSGR